MRWPNTRYAIPLFLQTHRQQYKENPFLVEEPDERFLVSSLDLIDGIITGLGPSAESLINDNIIQIVLETIKMQETNAIKSVYALVGDIAKNCLVHLHPILEEAIPYIIRDCIPRTIDVSRSNNAVWCIGEMIPLLGESFRPYAVDLIRCLNVILLNPNLHKNLLDNSALTVAAALTSCSDVSYSSPTPTHPSFS